jgi:hypothetical protein
MKKPENPPEVIDATVHTEVEPSPKLVAFLYLLLRDELPAGKIEKLISIARQEGDRYHMTMHLGEFAEELAKRLMAE